jgi:transcriptional regulator with XRE-family HTH domain
MFDGLSFADKLNEQMLLGGYDAKTLADAIGVSFSTVYNLRKCRYKQPDTNVFFSLIELFHCSADYMLGLVDFPPENIIYHSPLRYYGERLKELLKNKGETQKAFIENMHISSHLAYKWFSNKTLPGVDYLIRIANYFDISVDSLICRVK